ncbi:hypothetical protein BC827DRAFT_327709 [Russula dissimulans]|nr:hypothetical protein BC827DRAFT_327709 [Russula dissimulans]
MASGRCNDQQGSPWSGYYFPNPYDDLLSYADADHGNDRQPEFVSVHYPDRESHSQIFNSRGEYTGAGTSVDPGANLNLLGLSFDAPPYSTSHVDESSFQIPQQDSALAIPHISQLSGMISGPVGGNNLVVAHPEPPGQCNAQATRRSIFGPMGYVQPPCIIPTLLQDRVVKTQFKAPTPKRRTNHAKKRCPVCLASLGRPQDRERHMLSHLPYWLYCADPGCSWRGGRWEALNRHRRNAHPSSSQEPVKGDASAIIYDPWPLVKGIIVGDVPLEEARKYAVSMVEKKALELTKSELWKDFWGRKGRRSRLAPDKNQ